MMLGSFGGLAFQRSIYSLEVPPLKGYVNDLAELLPDDYAADLEERLRHFEEKTGDRILVLAVTNVEGEDVKDFTRKVFKDWQDRALTKRYPARLRNPPRIAVVVIVKNEKKIGIESTRPLQPIVTDPAIIRRVERPVANYLGGYRPDLGVESGLQFLAKRINNDYPLGLPAKQSSCVRRLRCVP